ncbi:MAG: phosphate ABC transporter ATP-binding protein [Nitrospirota bacterium]
MRPVFSLKDVSLYYGKPLVLKDISLTFNKGRVISIIGPSGAGKSTLLRTLNRMNDHIPGFRLKGEVLFDDKNIYNNGTKVHLLRQNVGMVFQTPCIFPKSIYDNVLFGVKHLCLKKKSEFSGIVEETLKSVSLWGEVKDKLNRSALELSQGQQQRLSIARALAVEPGVLLMDEPTSSLDATSTGVIEELVMRLKGKLTIIMITHKLEQAKKIADDVVFICEGKVIEQGTKEKLFTNPQEDKTKTYLNNEYCKC